MSDSNGTIRIAVPTDRPGGLDSTRSAHFGQAASFTLVDIADGVVTASTVLENGPHAEGGCLSVVDRLVAAEVTAVIAGGMGGGPRSGFASAGVPVYFDAVSPTPADAVAAFLAGTAEAFGPQHTCQGH